jgi:hypothetical protein
MRAFFDSIYPDRRLVSPHQLQTMLKLSQQDLMSGLVEISFGSDEQILLLLNGGRIAAGYRYEGEVAAGVSLPEVAVLLAGDSPGAIRVCPLAPPFLRALKTIMGQSHSAQTIPSGGSTIPQLIQQTQALEAPCLLHVFWPNAEGFVFVPGNNFPARQYAFLTEGQPSDSAAAVSMFSRWSEADCVVWQYPDDPALEIWKENDLQLGFALLVEHLVHRYEVLVGHLLSRKLEDSLNRLSRSHAWSITISNTAVDDVQLFDSLDDAVVAYRLYFDLVSQQIGGMIGTRLFNEALENGLDGLSGSLRQAVQNAGLVSALPAS